MARNEAADIDNTLAGLGLHHHLRPRPRRQHPHLPRRIPVLCGVAFQNLGVDGDGNLVPDRPRPQQPSGNPIDFAAAVQVTEVPSNFAVVFETAVDETGRIEVAAVDDDEKMTKKLLLLLLLLL